jgi:hypothetical protein
MAILGGRGPESFSRSMALELPANDPVRVTTDADRGGTEDGLEELECLLDLRFPLLLEPRPAFAVVPSPRSDSPPLGGAVDRRSFTDSSSFSVSSAFSVGSIKAGSCTWGIGPEKSRPVSRLRNSRSES